MSGPVAPPRTLFQLNIRFVYLSYISVRLCVYRIYTASAIVLCDGTRIRGPVFGSVCAAIITGLSQGPGLVLGLGLGRQILGNYSVFFGHVYFL